MSAETFCNASASCGGQCILASRKMASGFCSRTLSVRASGQICLSTLIALLDLEVESKTCL